MVCGEGPPHEKIAEPDPELDVGLRVPTPAKSEVSMRPLSLRAELVAGELAEDVTLDDYVCEVSGGELRDV
jgi:hypothetical protein